MSVYLWIATYIEKKRMRKAKLLKVKTKKKVAESMLNVSLMELIS